MKILPIAALMFACACTCAAQVTCTTVVGNIQTPTLQPFTGLLDLAMVDSIQSGAQIVSQGSISYPMPATKKGRFRQCMAPGVWVATYRPDGGDPFEKTWSVPTSSTPVNAGDIQGIGKVTLTAPPRTGTYCTQSVDGVVVLPAWSACSSGGSGSSALAWASMTNSQWTSMTNSQWTGMGN